MPKRVPDPARERLWRKRIARWKASGLRPGDVCNREGVTLTAFAHWRKEVVARDARMAATDEPTFVPVRITPAVVTPALDVVLPSGLVVRVPPGFDPTHLRAVVA